MSTAENVALDKKNERMRTKTFVPRESLLTDLYKVNHIRTIYNIFLASFIILFLNTMLQDFVETGHMSFGLKTIKFSFDKFSYVIEIWMIMKFLTVVLYLGFSAWSYTHLKLPTKSVITKILDYGFAWTFAIFLIAFTVLPAKFLTYDKFPPASSLVVLMEQVRMLMKTYAFVRSNAAKILKSNEPTRVVHCPRFSQFLYFMFAPTLIYKDEYPRTNEIKWRKVLWNFGEVILIIFYQAFVFERFFIPHYDKFGLKVFEPRFTLLTVFSMMLPAITIYLLGFYVVLHSWQNGMAELLRFADKLFYKDWWNCTSYTDYYRDWNIIVQDWLYYYVYQDVYARYKSKFVSTMTVFLLSAIFHEYIMAFAFRFFYPVMLLLFGVIGLFMLFLSKKFKTISGNTFMWFSFITGNGIMFAFYSMEYYARFICPPNKDEFVDIFTPRSWTCREVGHNNVTATFPV